MRSRRPASSAWTWFVCRRLRFRLVAFLVRMWLRLAWPALYLPEAVLRKRLAAARLVLILGIAMSLIGSFVTGRAVFHGLCDCVAKHTNHAFHPCPCRFEAHAPDGGRQVLGVANSKPGRTGPPIMPAGPGTCKCRPAGCPGKGTNKRGGGLRPSPPGEATAMRPWAYFFFGAIIMTICRPSRR